MRVTVVRPGDLGSAEARTWAGFQQLSPAAQSPFLSLTFAQTVGRARPGARVAVVEDNGRIEAFLPFELGSMRVAVPIGYPMSDLQGLVGSGAPVDLRRVVRRAGLRGWRYIHAPAGQQALAPHHYQGATGACPVIDLTGGYPAYHASRPRSVTAEPARKRRVLERERGPVSLVWSAAGPEYLRQMISWKSGKYSSLSFAEDPAGRAIAEELAASDHEDCRGIVSVLMAGDRPVAISANLLGPGGLTAWLTSYDPEISRSSPGIIMSLALVEAAASQGVSHIDLGPGAFSYKFRLATGSYPVAGGGVWALRAEDAARRAYRHLYYNRHREQAAAPPVHNPAPA
jgi:CelD/BcsL family acetyltransferase involved in cellulose biosynthesis